MITSIPMVSTLTCLVRAPNCLPPAVLSIRFVVQWLTGHLPRTSPNIFRVNIFKYGHILLSPPFSCQHSPPEVFSWPVVSSSTQIIYLNNLRVVLNFIFEVDSAARSTSKSPAVSLLECLAVFQWKPTQINSKKHGHHVVFYWSFLVEKGNTLHNSEKYFLSKAPVFTAAAQHFTSFSLFLFLALSLPSPPASSTFLDLSLWASSWSYHMQ